MTRRSRCRSCRISRCASCVDAAIYFHDRGKYNVAALHVRLFLKAVGHAKYKEIPGENFNGDHLMRGSNLEFMYAEKILPFEP